MNTNLSVSILNGQVKAAAFRRGTKKVDWESGQALGDFTGLGLLLREAVARTHTEGKHLSLVLADPRLSDQLVEVPDTRGGTLKRLLDRQAQRMKAFPEPAIWSAQPALPGKSGKAMLLHLCPRPLLDQINRACAEADLRLVRLLPTTAVLVSHLKSLPLQKDEVALLAAESGRSTTIVVGRKDGRICLGRVLPHTWQSAPDKVWMDLTRSILFAEQQSGIAVSSIWLYGQGAESQLTSGRSLAKIPVRVSPVAYSANYWAELGAKIPEKEDGNLISAEMREAPQRQKFMTVTAVLVALLAIGALAAAGVIEFIRRGEVQGIAGVTQQISTLKAEKAEVEKNLAELERMRKTAEFVENKVPPAPGWFLAYLGQVMPNELAVTSLRVTRTNDFWSVQMAGTAEARTNILETLNSLSNNLANSSFKLAISDCNLGTPADRAGASATAKWLPTKVSQAIRRDEIARNPGSFGTPTTFYIHGVMQ